MFLAVSGLSCNMQGLRLVRGLLCSCGNKVPERVGSVVCSLWAQLPRGMWDLHFPIRD